MTNEEIAVRLENHEQEIKSLKYRMKEQDEKDKTLSELAISVKTLAVNMEFMAKEQKKQGAHLERLEQEPKDEYKHYKRLVVGCVITTVIGAVLGVILATVL